MLLALVALSSGCNSQRERAVTAYAGPYTDNSLPEEIALAQPLSFEDATLAAVAYSQVFLRTVRAPALGARGATSSSGSATRTTRRSTDWSSSAG